MSRMKYSIAAIDRLPVELLSYVLVLGTQRQQTRRWYELDEDWDTHPYVNDLPTTAACVSSRWRQVALSTPDLWTSVCISLGDIRRHVIDSSWRDELPSERSRFLDTRRLDLYIIRSQLCPLDVLVDARDPQWDFMDPEGPQHQMHWNSFLPADMRGALTYLLQSMSRWRSLMILTDTFAPMYAALQYLSDSQDADQLSSERPPAVAPILESLTLMRCNEYAAYSPIFNPEDMRNPFYLPFGGRHERGSLFSHLPKLNRLILSGVHIDWSRVGPSPNGLAENPAASLCTYSSLETLELSYHCADVRPTLRQFVQLLRGCPGLSKLVLRVSGPTWETDGDAAFLESVAIPLDCLQTLCIAYVDPDVSLQWLKMLNARNLKELEIEDASHSIDFNEDDGADMIQWIGGSLDVSRVIVPSVDLLPFPKLETLKLRRIHIENSQPIANLLSKLTLLRGLSLDSPSLPVIDALRPALSLSGPSHVCPHLVRLHVRATQDVLDIVKEIIVRRAGDGLELREASLELFGQGRDVRQEWEADVMALVLSVGGDMDAFINSVDVAPPDEQGTDEEAGWPS
ncbi:hypothetical protein OE88DRAFT_802593 [Heliocybe sulcata]|uniref:Uncharacterized protein n=1 Tax=Heliocybe sulcata TaxID=5364 RepID=A0A5C3MQY6_9AGAM|nr:hypothetical protein OE88DRAFT_802593 [Heliocybe sulcata]